MRRRRACSPARTRVCRPTRRKGGVGPLQVQPWLLGREKARSCSHEPDDWPRRGLLGTKGWQTNRDDFPAPADGFVLTHFLVVADQDRSRAFISGCPTDRWCWDATRSSSRSPTPG
jgi:hypothetical protein